MCKNVHCHPLVLRGWSCGMVEKMPPYWVWPVTDAAGGIQGILHLMQAQRLTEKLNATFTLSSSVNKHLYVASQPSRLAKSKSPWNHSMIKLDWCFIWHLCTPCCRRGPCESGTALGETSPVSVRQHQKCFNSPLMACPLPLLGGSRVSVTKRGTPPDDGRWRALLFSLALTQIRQTGVCSNTIFIQKTKRRISILVKH